MNALVPLLVVVLSMGCFAQEPAPSCGEEAEDHALPAPEAKTEYAEEGPCAELSVSKEVPCNPKKWYFELKPGYFYFTDSDMQQFFNNGGFTFRGEVGYQLWGPLIVWVDGGYFQKDGQALGGTEKIDFQLASITLGLKAIYYFHKRVAVYAGAGPRLFMMLMHNHSPFVRSDDNEIGIGGGFDGGAWFFPIPRWPNVFLDLFADYSWKSMSIEPDEISSDDSDVDVSSLTVGLGLGVRF